MGIDVYVPRDAPLARKLDCSPEHASATMQAPPMPASVGILVRGVAPDEHPRLLAAVLRAGGFKRENWTLSPAVNSAAKRWGFGDSTAHDDTPVDLKLPSLGTLRDSVRVRREAWRTLRTWIRAQ